MLFFLNGRMPFLGVIIGVALIIWGVAGHSALIAIIGGIATVVGVYRTIGASRQRR